MWIGKHIEEAFRVFGNRSFRVYRKTEIQLYKAFFGDRDIMVDRHDRGDWHWRLVLFANIAHFGLGVLLYVATLGSPFGVLAVILGTGYKEWVAKGDVFKRTMDFIAYNTPGVLMYYLIFWRVTKWLQS